MSRGTAKVEICDVCEKAYLHGDPDDQPNFPFGIYINKGLFHQPGRYDILKNQYACSKECAHKLIDKIWESKD